jgi:hypothetical protein
MEDNMELKDFVSETLVQVMQGVKMAQDKAAEFGGTVNPKGFVNSEKSTPRNPVNDLVAQLISFDIVVSTHDADKAKGGVGVFVGEVGIGVRGEAESQSTAVNKIQFSVPIYLPTQEITKR